MLAKLRHAEHYEFRVDQKKVLMLGAGIIGLLGSAFFFFDSIILPVFKFGNLTDHELAQSETIIEIESADTLLEAKRNFYTPHIGKLLSKVDLPNSAAATTKNEHAHSAPTVESNFFSDRSANKDYDALSIDDQARLDAAFQDPIKVLEAVCETCSMVVKHLEKFGYKVVSVEDLRSLITGEAFAFRVTIANVCYQCYQALAFAEENMFGRVLSTEEAKRVWASSEFDGMIEAARAAGMLEPQQVRDKDLELLRTQISKQKNGSISSTERVGKNGYQEKEVRS